MLDIIIWGKEPEILVQSIEKYNLSHEDSVRYFLLDENAGAQEWTAALQQLTAQYFCMAHAQDTIDFEMLGAIAAQAEKEKDLLLIEVQQGYGYAKRKVAKERRGFEGEISRVNLDTYTGEMPLFPGGCLIQREAARESLPLGAGGMMGLLANIYKKTAARGGFAKTYTDLWETEYSLTQRCHERDWYWELRDIFAASFLEFQGKEKRLPRGLQYTLLYQLWLRFSCNINLNNKHALDNEISQYYAELQKYLHLLDDEVIIGAKPQAEDEDEDIYIAAGESAYTKKIKIPRHFRVSAIECKYGEEFHVDYPIVEKPDSEGETAVGFAVNGCLLGLLRNEKINLGLLEFTNDNKELIIEGHIDNYFDISQCELLVFCGERQLLLEETYRYSHTKYFGVSAQKAYTFRVTVPTELFDVRAKEQKIRFFVKQGENIIPLIMNAKKYPVRLCTTIQNSYWASAGYILKLNKERTEICICRKKHNMLRHEIKFLFSMIFGKEHSGRMFLFRVLYWLTRPYFKKRKIWLTYDKLYKGGDCGEYLYRYMVSRGEPGIVPAYVVNRDSDDYRRLRKEGFHPLPYGSLWQRLCYVNSDVVFTTHGGVPTFNSFTMRQLRFIQGVLHHDVACIQHGLSVQQLAYNSNRLANNMKRYYCASRYEVQNLSHPIYGYEDKSLLRLTGIPRYDGLVNNDQRQILITPTWRNYIAMPATAKNQPKAYYPGFRETDYFKIYNRLLRDERLAHTARKYNYKVIYLLHPVISAQIEDYPSNDYVEVVPASTVNYEKILTESSLMLTDYSGVQFDFAYMRKPVVYYHPDELPPHYLEGGFFYDTMGFGEICKKHDELVEVLCEYMKNNCALKDFYKNREDDFFAYSDLNNCKRIFEDMLAYQDTK